MSTSGYATTEGLPRQDVVNLTALTKRMVAEALALEPKLDDFSPSARHLRHLRSWRHDPVAMSGASHRLMTVLGRA